MPKTITQLPAATVVSGAAVVAADNATGTLTEKVTLSAIAGLASAGNTVVSSGGIANLTSGQQSSIKEGTVVTTTDGRRWVYSGSGSKTAEASYVLLADVSPDWSTLTGVPSTFPPETHTHTIASITDFPTTSNDGYVVAWDATAGAWVAEAPSGGGSLPSGSSTGDVLTWDNSTLQWGAAAVPAELPGTANTNDVLSWNGSAWAAVAPTTPGLPSGSQGQYLVKGSMDWQAGNAPVPTSANANDALRWDSSVGAWVARTFGSAYGSSTGYQAGDVVTHNGVLYQATASGMGNEPPNGSYWATLTLGAELPSTATDGDVLTYTMQDGWVAQAPAGGGGLTAVHAQSASDETATSMTASTSVKVIVQGSATYLVQGLALLSIPEDAADASLRVDLSFGTGDGDLTLDFDVAHDQTGNEYSVDYRTDQTDYPVVTIANTAESSVTVPIRFRGYLTTGEISSSDLRVVFGDEGNTDTITLKAKSWLVAIRLD